MEHRPDLRGAHGKAAAKTVGRCRRGERSLSWCGTFPHLASGFSYLVAMAVAGGERIEPPQRQVDGRPGLLLIAGRRRRLCAALLRILVGHF